MLALKAPSPEVAHVTSVYILTAKEVTCPRSTLGMRRSTFFLQDGALSLGEQKSRLPQGHRKSQVLGYGPRDWDPQHESHNEMHW